MLNRRDFLKTAVIGGTGLTAMGLVGCSSSSETTQDETEVQQETDTQEEEVQEEVQTEQEDITLRFSWWGGDTRHQALLEVIELYQEKNPNVTIEAEYQGYDGYYEKMLTTISSGTAPDLMQFKKEWLPDVQGSNHYLADLSELSVDTSTLAEGLMEKSGSYNGEDLLFSAMVTAQVVYVNTEFAEEYGIDIDKIYTWDEFMELGQQVHEANSEDYLMTADVDVLNRLIIPAYIGQVTGGSLVDQDTYELNFTKEQMTDAFQLILDMYETNTLEPFGDSSVFAGQIDQNTNWINGNIGMILDGTSSFAKYKASISADIDVMAIPQTEDAKNSGVNLAGDTGFVINDNSAYKEAAAEFLDFLMNDAEAALIIQDNYGYNSTSTAIEALEEAGMIDETLKKAIDIAQEDAMSINLISSNSELESIRKDLLEEVVYYDITPEEAAEELISQYEEILSEQKES